MIIRAAHRCQRSRFDGSGFRVQGSGFRVQGSGCRVQGAGFRVQGVGCRVQGSGFASPCHHWASEHDRTRTPRLQA